MDEENMKFGKDEWFSKTITKFITNESLQNIFYSWGEFSEPVKYTHCDGSNLAIRKCTFDTQIFTDCDFSRIDASDSTFINCLFFNCIFHNANFYKSTFIGSAIINDDKLSNEDSSTLSGTGMSQTKFKNSDLNKSMLINLNLDGCSFRHSIFDDAILNNVSVIYTSFEDAYFKGCKIDKLDLRKSACRGVIFINCEIENYISSVEKILGSIGALQILEHCKNIELSFLDNKITKEALLISKLKESSENFLSEGKLFEFINIMYYILEKTKDIKIKNISASKFDLTLFSEGNYFNGYKISDMGKQLYSLSNQAYETIIKNGKEINLDDILYSLKLIFFLNVNEYVLLKFLLDVFKIEMQKRNSDYSDFLIVSQINQYFQAIGEKIKSCKYKITFYNETASWQNRESRNDFDEFCRTFIKQGTGESNFKLVSMHEGSIEAIFETLFNFNNILIASAVLGCKFGVINGKLTIVFDPKLGIKSYANFLKSIASILPLIGDKKPSKDEFDSVLKKITKVSKSLINYILKNKVKGNVEQGNASEEIEEIIKETRLIDKKEEGIKIYETIEIKRKTIKKIK